MRLIDADEFYREISATYFFEPDKLFVIESAIKNTPTIDAAPVVRRKWTRCETTEEKYRCNHCGYVYYPATKLMHNYCPNCGACMKEV